MAGANIDRDQNWQASRITKNIVTVEFTSLYLCRVRNFIKIEAFAVLRPKVRPKRGQLPTLTGVKCDKHQKLQKALATIEFTALDLCRVRIFIKIEAFAVLRPKLRPKIWQVPTLTSVKNHRKLLPSMNSAPWNCWLTKISWKMVNLIPRFPFPAPLFKDSRNFAVKIIKFIWFNKFHQINLTVNWRLKSLL